MILWQKFKIKTKKISIYVCMCLNTFQSWMAKFRSNIGNYALVYLFNYDNKIWSEYKLVTTTNTDAKNNTFLLYIHGILYLLTPDGQTFTFDAQSEQWKLSNNSLVDPKTHRISKQLSTIRLSNVDILGWTKIHQNAL